MLYWVKLIVFIAAFAVVIFLLHLLLLIRYGFLPKNINNFVTVVLVLGYLCIFLLKLILSFMRKVFCKINCTVLKLTSVCSMQVPHNQFHPQPVILRFCEVSMILWMQTPPLCSIFSRHDLQRTPSSSFTPFIQFCHVPFQC